MTAAPPLQLDWIRLDDHRAAARRFLAAAAERIGIAQLAHWLDEDPSTLRNQLAYRDRKRPSAELCQLVYLLDEQYRRDMAGLCGEMLSRPPDLTPEEALREATVRAQAQGYIAAPDIAALLARTKPGRPGVIARALFLLLLPFGLARFFVRQLARFSRPIGGAR